MSNQKHQSIHDLIGRMAVATNIPCRVEIAEEEREGKQVINASVYTPEHAHVLIGKNGQNLQALEHIARAVLTKENQEALVSLDINDYKKSRTLQVLGIARQAVSHVRNTRRAQALDPMSAYERRMVHMELASITDVVTESIGQEPQRRIVIKPL